MARFKPDFKTAGLDKETIVKIAQLAYDRIREEIAQKEAGDPVTRIRKFFDSYISQGKI